MANPINILHLAPFYPPHVGGLESHAAGFDQHLANSSTIITVFTPRIPTSAQPIEQPNQYLTIYRYPATEIIPNYPLPAIWHPQFWQLLSQARARHPDIIISRTRFFLPSLLATILAKLTRTKHLHIEHGSDFVSLSNPLTQLFAKIYDLTIGRAVIKSADILVANSQASARFTEKLSGRHAQVIYRGINKVKIASVQPATDIREKYPNKTIITFIGRLIDGKGVDDLITALNTANLKTFHCLIIGSGPQAKHLKELATKLNLNNKITFLGEQRFERTISILKSSDIFVNPSHTEGLPTSVIEAALCKVAIIATDIGGTPEIVTHQNSALLIPPKQPSILAANLTKLIENPTLRQTLAQNASSEVISEFHWPEAVDKYKILFDKLARN